MKSLTIDRAIELLQDAKERIGGDKPVVVTSGYGYYYEFEDYGHSVEEENDWAHLSAIEQHQTNWGLSLMGAKRVDDKELSLEEIKQLM